MTQKDIEARNKIADLCNEADASLKHLSDAIVRQDAVPENAIDVRRLVAAIHAIALAPTDFADLDIEPPAL